MFWETILTVWPQSWKTLDLHKPNGKDIIMQNNCEMAIAILQKTNDGDDLDPKELKLLENAVNGFLNDYGQKLFTELHQRVIAGTYKKPFFHNIEHLTINHVGYVYWKGKMVEHYSLSWAYSQDAEKSARELARRCLYLEQIGIEVNSSNAVWLWEKYEKKETNNGVSATTLSGGA